MFLTFGSSTEKTMCESCLRGEYAFIGETNAGIGLSEASHFSGQSCSYAAGTCPGRIFLIRQLNCPSVRAPPVSLVDPQDAAILSRYFTIPTVSGGGGCDWCSTAASSSSRCWSVLCRQHHSRFVGSRRCLAGSEEAVSRAEGPRNASRLAGSTPTAKPRSPRRRWC